MLPANKELFCTQNVSISLICTPISLRRSELFNRNKDVQCLHLSNNKLVIEEKTAGKWKQESEKSRVSKDSEVSNTTKII